MTGRKYAAAALAACLAFILTACFGSSLGRSLSTNDRPITTQPGDVILYQGSSVTIYYDTNTWSLTLLGRIQGLSQEELKDILGGGSVTVTFSLKENI